MQIQEEIATYQQLIHFLLIKITEKKNYLILKLFFYLIFIYIIIYL